MKQATKLDGIKYWSYIIFYVEDILCIDHDPKLKMKIISDIYRMKQDSIETPKFYLGANIKQWNLQDIDG